MNGVLGTHDLLANINQALYYNNYDEASLFTVSFCNRGNTTALVSIALSTSSTTPSNAEWLVFNLELRPKEVYEKKGIYLSANMYLIGKSSVANVSAVVYGFTNDMDTAPTSLITSLGTAPTWDTAATLPVVFAGDPTTSVALQASDAEGEAVTYSFTAGSLVNLSLSSAGVLSGTPSTAGYSSGAPDSTTTATIAATDSRNNQTSRVFSIIRRFRDGSSSGQAAPNAETIKNLTGTTTNGQYWIQPAGAPSAQQVFCIMDTSIGDGGGWMAAFNILSTSVSGMPGGPADWNNVEFWDVRDGTFNTGFGLNTNFKNNVYGYAPVRKVNILLHNISNTSFRGFGQYDLLSTVRGRTMFDYCGGGISPNPSIDNRVASAGRTAGSGASASGTVRNVNRNQSEGFDLFVDSQNSSWNLVFRARDLWESQGTFTSGVQANSVRIGTSIAFGNPTYGHTFAGIGGTHEHSGWKQDFAMAPVSAYCDNPQSYGDRTSGINATRYEGFSYPYETTCTNFTGGPGQLNVGYAVFVK